MKLRILSTLILGLGIPLLLWLFGPQGGVWLLAIAAFVTQWEVYLLFQRGGLRPLYRLGLFFGALIMLGTYYLPTQLQVIDTRVGTDLLILATVFSSIGILIIEKDSGLKFRSLVATLFGILYVPFLMHFAVLLILAFESEVQGMMMVVWLIGVAKTSDIGALLVGRWRGKTLLSPNVSPGKTWEGAVGGLVIAATIGVILAWALERWLPPNFTILGAALLAAPIGVVAIFSDLVESLFKRNAGVKDSGYFVPGIGGVFDLTDSLLLSIPFGYFIVRYILV